MRVEEGQQAPDFAVSDLQGRPRSLSEHRGERVWLALFRFAACPFCLFRVHRLGLETERIEALRLRCLAVFPSRPELLQKYVAKFPLPFEVLADPAQTVNKLYEAPDSVLGTMKSLRRPAHMLGGIRAAQGWSPLDSDGSSFQMPADFLLDEEHRVRVAYYGREADDGIPLERVVDFANGS